ncbi:Signal transduction histidine kinase [Parvularcula bermudensis HTCC2503]|uniref:histidine kinase n=1 Tax=Parvularcula bermudensis (strain ATCC BAA-594 / HTCC2503 / KCTC 12087) TaxID=314260 RepID=E0TD10_PARBH|nr:response regulator [Parvularcula bermudensis]ADM08669.1 Signal transduction histidine kinase [Parvularcula bermudensis HTCC2503]
MRSALAVLDRITLFAVLTDRNGVIRFRNKVSAGIGGLRTGQIFTEEQLPPTIRCIRTTDQDRFTTSVIVNNDNRLIEWNPSRFTDGETLYLGTDVTRDRKNYAVMRELARTARAVSEEKMRYLATMSHEMRTPLNGILGMNGLLLDSPLDVNQRAYAEAVQQAGTALLTLINDVLDYSKIQAGHLDLEEKPFSPGALLKEVAEILAIRADEKGIDIALLLHPDIPEELVGDPARLRQVLVNLATNGVKFTTEGGVSLEILPGTGSTDDDLIDHRRYSFRVRDTGKGIAADNLDRLFEEFDQGSDPSAEEGTGLGLTIARQLVNAMGGNIDVTSALGKGSTFEFDIALKGQAPTAVQIVENPARTVVVASPSAFLRAALTTTLQYLGINRLHTAQDEREAISLLSDHPDAILLCDLPLAESSGSILTKGTQHAIVLLSQRTRGRFDSFAKNGFADFLVKPVFPAQLRRRLETIGRPAISAAEEPVASASASGEGVNGDDQPPSEAAPSSAPASSASQKPLNILLAEDNSINAVLAETILRRDGHQVDLVRNGKEAVEAVDLSVYDLILMDMRMPVMDGIEATVRIRQMPTGEVLPIIALTANATTADRQACLEAGMNDFLSKPFEPKSLSDIVNRWRSPPPSPSKTATAGRS